MENTLAILLFCLFRLALPAVADPYQLPWMTDDLGISNSSYLKVFGPDGPWNAIATYVGESLLEKRLPIPMYPSSISATSVIAKEEQSAIHLITGWPFEPILMNSSGSPTGAEHLIDSTPMRFTNWKATPVAVPQTALAMTNAAFQLVNASNQSVFALVNSSIQLSNGSRITPMLGFLGIAGIAKELHRSKDTGSESFGLHIGAATLQQAGSLVVGGYEQSRALGPVGLFSNRWIGSEQYPILTGFLMDVQLGVEVGGSPFNESGIIRAFRGHGGDAAAAATTKSLGGPRDAATITISPTVPYMYLPPGVCEAVASHLPVTFNEGIGIYIWNTNDPNYNQITSSPAYLALTIADRDAVNITIKVPFRVLNLTLEPPLVASALPYFPCKPLKSPENGYWALGRAFLQAAFISVNYHQNVTFLAQAPGPGIDKHQIVTKPIKPEDENITSSSIDVFEKSWDGYWAPLPEASGLTTTGLVCLVISALIGAALVHGALLFLQLQKKRKQKPCLSVMPAAQTNAGLRKEVIEIDGIAYTDGSIRAMTPKELGSDLVHEAVTEDFIYEAPG